MSGNTNKSHDGLRTDAGFDNVRIGAPVYDHLSISDRYHKASAHDADSVHVTLDHLGIRGCPDVLTGRVDLYCTLESMDRVFRLPTPIKFLQCIAGGEASQEEPREDENNNLFQLRSPIFAATTSLPTAAAEGKN